jgi:hypothetical protein
MADIYTYKSPMGKTTKYLKKGGKYYRIKDNGQLAKESTTGSLILGNLKNKDSSFVEKVNAKETKRIVSNFIMPDGKANASTIKASVKDDGGKAAVQASKEYKNRPAAKLREKRALDIIKNDTNIKTNDYKPLKDVDKKKELKTLKEYEPRNVKVYKTKSLQNTTTEKETNKEKETPKKSKSFLDRVTEDFSKAVKETKRNIQGDIKTGTGRYKSVNEKNLDSNGNYKGTNIKPTKLQLSRMSAGGMTKKKKKK